MTAYFLQLFLLFSCCSLFSIEDIQNHVSYSYEYDGGGNPVKLTIISYQVRVPVIDGIRMNHERKEYSQKQEFIIDKSYNLDETSQNQTLDIQFQEYEKNLYDKTQNASMHNQQRLVGAYVGMRVVPHEPGFFESMSDQDWSNFIAYEYYCRAWYHMSSSDKESMLCLSCNKFKDKLLSNNTLSDRALLELLSEYRYRNNGRQKYKDLEIDVQKALQDRNEIKEQDVQKQLLQQADQQKKF